MGSILQLALLLILHKNMERYRSFMIFKSDCLMKLLTKQVYSLKHRFVCKNHFYIDTILKSTKLETTICGTDNFIYDDKAEIKFKSVDTFTCIKDKSYLRAGGAYLSNEY